jgi:hypothetical protein
VSADERHAEVITYIPIKTDNEKVFMESGSAFLIEWAKASAYERVMEVEAIKELYHDATVNRISQELGIPSSEVKLENIIDRITVEGTRATPVTMPGTQIISAVYPLVPVQWNQTAPYNLSLPTPDSPATQSHVYTGCAVTAACQLLVATKPNLTIDGITMNWDYLAETKTISSSATQAKLNMLGKLHTWVYQTLDASPVYDSYGYHTGTGVLSSKSAWFYGAYLNSSIGYSAYDADNLKSSFDQSRPAFIHGQGHAWIIDGYIIAKKPFSPVSSTNTRMVMKSYDVFWHANLGWGGSQDGYYKLKLDTHVDFESGSYTFNTTALNIYPGLYTKNIAHNVTTYSW